MGSGVQMVSLPAGEDLHPGEGAVLGGGIDDEFGAVLDGAAYIVGQAAARVGDVPVLDQNGHIRGLILPFNFGSSLGTGGNAAQNQ